jgi:hypothetical protein
MRFLTLDRGRSILNINLDQIVVYEDQPDLESVVLHMATWTSGGAAPYKPYIIQLKGEERRAFYAAIAS